MPQPALSTSWKPTTAAFSPIALAWERHSRHWRHQVLRASQSLGPGALPKEARRQLADLQSQPEDQHICQGSFQLRRSVPHRPAANLWRIVRHAAERINWGNYDLVVIDESHNFRNNDAFKERETRYQKLMNTVIRDGVKTKVLMLSATPVNNRFTDLQEPTGTGLRRRIGEHRTRSSHRQGHQRDFPPGPGDLQHLVASCRRKSAPLRRS